MVVPDVGGGFGAKSRTYPEELALGFYARAVGRPVRWTETRSENMMAMPHGRSQVQHARIGGTRDGHVTAYQLDVVQDAGAFPLTGAVLHTMTMRMATGVYHIPNVGFTGESVVTNASSITAYRGAGRPEAAVAIERMIDLFANEIGMDPAEVRRRNLVPRFLEPYTTGIGTAYDVGDYPEAARAGSRRRRLRRPARRAIASSRGRRSGRARHRHLRLRGDHGGRSADRVRGGRGWPGRSPHRAHRGRHRSARATTRRGR